MKEKKQAASKQTPEHQIHSGTVTASIYLRQSNCGVPYFDFSLTRSWKSVTTGKEAHGTSFFDRNEEDLIRAIQMACEWIRDKARPAPLSGSSSSEENHA